MTREDKVALEEALANIRLSGLSVPKEVVDKMTQQVESGTFDSASFIKDVLKRTTAEQFA